MLTLSLLSAGDPFVPFTRAKQEVVQKALRESTAQYGPAEITSFK